MKMKNNLDELYKDLLTGKKTCEEVSDIMKSGDLSSNVNAYIHKDSINPLVPYTDEDLQNIYMIINITQFIYNNSGLDTGLTDEEYDALYSIMLDNGGSDVISVPITPTAKSPLVYHKYPSLRGTLTKVYYLSNDEERNVKSRRFLDEWKTSMESKIFTNSGKTVDLDDEDIYVFPKFDGVSGIFEMNADGTVNRVLTRGFTETNEATNVAHIFKDFEREPKEIKNQPYGLKTEIMMKESDLKYYNEKYKTDYKNTRSIVSAIINSDEYDAEKSSLLHVVPLRISDENQNQDLAMEVFKKYPYIRCKLKDRDKIRDFAFNHKYVNGELRCDGAVIYIINPEIQEILGRENNKNNFEVAYKFTEEAALTKLIDINFNMGEFGRLAPVAQVKPVKLKGNTIENISLGSIGRMRSLKLRKGDTVKVLYDIIPYLSFDVDCKHSTKNDIIKIPEYCPECGEPLESNPQDNIVYCTNEHCPSLIKGKIINYLFKMDIDNISYGVIDKLFDNGIVSSIKDLYSLDKHLSEIINIDGFGPTMVTKWINSINDKRTVADYQVFGALGIEGLSKKKFAAIFKEYDIDELMDIVSENRIIDLVKISGFEDKTSKKVIKGIEDNKKLIKFLIKELDIVETKYANKPKFTVCFTKIRDKDKEKFVFEHGGAIDDSLTSKTTLLVVPTLDTKSSKVDKANKYGIRVVPIDDLESTILNYIL